MSKSVLKLQNISKIHVISTSFATSSDLLPSKTAASFSSSRPTKILRTDYNYILRILLQSELLSDYCCNSNFDVLNSHSKQMGYRNSVGSMLNTEKKKKASEMCTPCYKLTSDSSLAPHCYGLRHLGSTSRKIPNIKALNI